jgi:hypothetical protein
MRIYGYEGLTHQVGRRWILKGLPDLNPNPVQQADLGIVIKQPWFD